MPVDTISVRPSSEKTVHETVIETVRAKGTDPSFELKEAGDDLARINMSAASLLALQTNIAAAGWVSYITVDSTGVLTFTQGKVTLPILSADPSTPAAGFSTLWVSDGTGSGSAGDVMSIDSAGAVDNLTSAAGGSGDVVGPASATDNALVRCDGTTGKLIQDSNATLGDNGGLSLTATAASEVLGSFTAHASQTANLTEWKSSGGSKLLSVDADGQLVSTLDPNVGDYALTSTNKLGIEATNAIWLNSPYLIFVQSTSITSPSGFSFGTGNNSFVVSPNVGTFTFKNSTFLVAESKLRSTGNISGNASNDETAKLDLYNYTGTTTVSGTIAEVYTSRIGTQTITHASTATTITNAASLVIENAPAAGTNVTITSKWAILVKTGISKFVDVVLTGIRQMLDKGSHPTLATGELADYRKGSLYVIAYNDGGTTKYRYLDLTSTDAVWTYTTTAP
jgi:hypothetical protein